MTTKKQYIRPFTESVVYLSGCICVSGGGGKSIGGGTLGGGGKSGGTIDPM